MVIEMKEILFFVIGIFSLQILYFLVKYFLKKFLSKKGLPSPRDAHKNTVQFPLSYKIYMAICGLAFIFFGILCIFVHESDTSWEEIVTACSIFCGLGVFSLGCSCVWTLWKATFDENGFTYRNYVGRKRTYSFAEVKIWEHPRGAKWFFLKDGKKILCISYFVTNGDALEEAYYKSQKSLP